MVVLCHRWDGRIGACSGEGGAWGGKVWEGWEWALEGGGGWPRLQPQQACCGVQLLRMCACACGGVGAGVRRCSERLVWWTSAHCAF